MTSLSRNARSLLGVPYVARAYNPAAGLCCYGLVRVAAARCGVELPTWLQAQRLLRSGLDNLQGALPLELVNEPQDGSILVMDPSARQVTARRVHLGIVGKCKGAWTLIHTSDVIGRVIEEPLPPQAYQACARFFVLI